MSRIVDARRIFNETDLSTQKSVVLDVGEADLLSIQIDVIDATGSNLLDLYESVNGTSFVPVASLVITIPGTTIWHIYPVFSRYKKILFVPGSGSVSFTVDLNVHNHTIQSTGDSITMIPGVS